VAVEMRLTWLSSRGLSSESKAIHWRYVQTACSSEICLRLGVLQPRVPACPDRTRWWRCSPVNAGIAPALWMSYPVFGLCPEVRIVSRRFCGNIRTGLHSTSLVCTPNFDQPVLDRQLLTCVDSLLGAVSPLRSESLSIYPLK
jgi:hypothetical protein